MVITNYLFNNWNIANIIANLFLSWMNKSPTSYFLSYAQKFWKNVFMALKE